MSLRRAILAIGALAAFAIAAPFAFFGCFWLVDVARVRSFDRAFDGVQPGMAREGVIQLMGPPDRQNAFRVLPEYKRIDSYCSYEVDRSHGRRAIRYTIGLDTRGNVVGKHREVDNGC